MRSALSVPVLKTVETRKSWEITVDVIEPEVEQPTPLLLPQGTYRIPRRPVPAEPAPRVHRLSKKKAAVLADKVAKQDLKRRRKVPPRNKRYCGLCHVSCNGSKTFYDHIQSKAHRIRLANKESPPRCIACNRTFESHLHLSRHTNSAGHLKVVTKFAN